MADVNVKLDDKLDDKKEEKKEDKPAKDVALKTVKAGEEDVIPGHPTAAQSGLPVAKLVPGGSNPSVLKYVRPKIMDRLDAVLEVLPFDDRNLVLDRVTHVVYDAEKRVPGLNLGDDFEVKDEEV